MLDIKDIPLSDENWTMTSEPQRSPLRLRLGELWRYRDLVMLFFLLVFLPSLVGMNPRGVDATGGGDVPAAENDSLYVNEAATRLDDPGACIPVKIMPLGDSITYDYHEGETRPASERIAYRLPLWELLIEGGYSVDFVGSRVAGDALGQDLVPPFDPDNEGHPSWTDDQIAAEIYSWLVSTPADVLLLHIGTNALDPSPADVENILNEVDRWEADTGNPVTVVLARIINRSIYSADTTAFNHNVAAMAQMRIEAGDEIIVIDMENGTGLNYGVDSTSPYDDGDLYDELHPNNAGYARMAAAWLNGDSSGSPGLADLLTVCDPGTEISHTLAVSRTGSGTGIVTSSPAGIDCGSDCMEDYALDTVVTLTAAAGPGSTFTGWSGANAAELVDNGDGTWNLTMDGDKAVTADFSLLPAQEPLGHWKFDESSWAGDCSTADIIDSSGNNRHGTACIDGDAPFPVPGRFENAGRFDGVNQYANMGPGFNFTSSFTAALWIALDDYNSCGPASTSQHIIGTHHLRTPTGNGRGWGIYWDCDGLAWELTNSTGSAIGSYGWIAPDPFPENGSWHHAALVYDSTVPSATLYWDGVAIYSESGLANVPGFLFDNGEPLTINGLPYAPGAGAPGKIDDTRVYNRALSPAEIEALAGSAPACYTLMLTSGPHGGVPSAAPLKSEGCPIEGEYLEGEAIALTAHPDPGYRISVWSGTADDASTALTNTLTMPAGDHSTSVAYAPEEYTLTITSEHGTVTSSPAGIDCGSDCTEDYALDTIVTLTADVGPGSAFTGWSGANAAELVDNGDGTWNLTMDGDKAISASFSFPPIAEEDAYNTDQDTVLNVAAPGVLGNDTDPDGSPITAVKVSEPANGTLSLDANGAFTYTPNPGFSGSDTFTYKARDGLLESNVASVKILVDGIPNTPADFPIVLSVLRANSSPSHASSVDFTITFSEPVAGVDAADFSLSTVGVMRAAITNVSGTGAVRTVTVGTGSGNGRIRLDVVDDNSILDASSNPLGGTSIGDGSFTLGESYTIKKTPTFTDVPLSHPYWQDIEILYANGLTAGCNTSPLKFCPDDVMDRAQSAVFMLRGSFGASYLPPASTHTFRDNWTPGTWAEKWADAMYTTSLSAGCATGPQMLFCPWEEMPRDQVAVFGLRLKYGNSYRPPPATGTVFADMPDAGYWGTKWAEQAFRDGLLPACGMSGGKPMFCPAELVTRGLGAYMIVRARNLTMP